MISDQKPTARIRGSLFKPYTLVELNLLTFYKLIRYDCNLYMRVRVARPALRSLAASLAVPYMERRDTFSLPHTSRRQAVDGHAVLVAPREHNRHREEDESREDGRHGHPEDDLRVCAVVRLLSVLVDATGVRRGSSR